MPKCIGDAPVIKLALAAALALSGSFDKANNPALAPAFWRNVRRLMLMREF